MTDTQRWELTRGAEDLAASFDALVLVLAEGDHLKPTTETAAELLSWLRATQRRLDWELRRHGARPIVSARELALTGD